MYRYTKIKVSLTDSESFHYGVDLGNRSIVAGAGPATSHSSQFRTKFEKRFIFGAVIESFQTGART